MCRRQGVSSHLTDSSDSRSLALWTITKMSAWMIAPDGLAKRSSIRSTASVKMLDSDQRIQLVFALPLQSSPGLSPDSCGACARCWEICEKWQQRFREYDPKMVS